jgi:hypothetical protein
VWQHTDWPALIPQDSPVTSRQWVARLQDLRRARWRLLELANIHAVLQPEESMKIFSILFTLLAMFAGQARASTFSVDYSDMWWNSSESGWGVNVNQQKDVLFLTFFIYGADGKALWLVAPNVPYVSGTEPNLQFTGPLYQTDGSWFGTTFSAANTHARQVGTVSFSTTGVATAAISYSVDGTNVSKTLSRQTWRTNDLNGRYFGAVSYAPPSCPSGGPFSPQALVTNVNIVHSDSSFAMSLVDSFQSCTYVGAYVQSGKFGSVSGTFTCNSGKVGTFTASEIDANRIGITGRLTRLVDACTIDASFAATIY